MKKTYYYYRGRYRGIAMILALPIVGIIIAIKEEMNARFFAKHWNNRENEKQLSDIIRKYERKK